MVLISLFSYSFLLVELRNKSNFKEDQVTNPVGSSDRRMIGKAGVVRSYGACHSTGSKIDPAGIL